MSKLSKLTVKQEKFAQKYVKCGCASEAYRHAYNTSRMKDKSIHELSCRLLADIKVSSRVDQLKVKASKRHEITLDKMLEMFLEDRDQAKALDQTSVAISADNSIAKMLGHMIERSEKKIDATIEHKVELIEQTKLQVLDLIAEVQQEKAPPIQKLRVTDDRVH